MSWFYRKTYVGLRRNCVQNGCGKRSVNSLDRTCKHISKVWFCCHFYLKQIHKQVQMIIIAFWLVYILRQFRHWDPPFSLKKPLYLEQFTSHFEFSFNVFILLSIILNKPQTSTLFQSKGFLTCVSLQNLLREYMCIPPMKCWLKRHLERRFN